MKAYPLKRVWRLPAYRGVWLCGFHRFTEDTCIGKKGEVWAHRRFFLPSYVLEGLFP